jgi:hypothetical protein
MLEILNRIFMSVLFMLIYWIRVLINVFYTDKVIFTNNNLIDTTFSNEPLTINFLQVLPTEPLNIIFTKL